MSEPNRSLRRKPPPPMDAVEIQKAFVGITPEPGLPPVPILTPEKPPVPFEHAYKSERRHRQISLTLNADFSYDLIGASEHDDFNEFAEDSLLSYESPRPKGPQSLPLDQFEYSTPTRDLVMDQGYYASASEPSSPSNHRQGLPPRPRNTADPPLASNSEERKPPKSNVLLQDKTSSYRQRKFQNLLQKGTSPFQLHEIDSGVPHDDLEPLTPDTGMNQVHSSLASDLPYPISNNFSSDEEEIQGTEETRKLPPYASKPDPRTAVFTTPTRIPSLADKDSMKMGHEHQLLHKKSLPEFKFLRSSPPRLLNLPSTSPELHMPQYFSSPLSSPTRASLYGRLPQIYSGVLSDGRSSRSPSPRKHLGSSPSTRSGPYPYEENYLNVFEDQLNQERVPRWSLIEDYDGDYHDHDHDDSFDMPPRAPHFDYTILPELPKQTNDTFDTLMLFISNPLQSLYPQELVFDPTPRPKLTLRKKNDALPPVPLDLPPLPFLPSSLGALHFTACSNVWSLKSIYDWCVQLHGWIHGQLLTVKEFRKTLMRLVAFHKQDVPIDLIGRNVSEIIDSFSRANLLLFEAPREIDDKQKQTFRFDISGTISGVLVDLTSCYCTDKDHRQRDRDRNRERNQADFSLKCYSSLCMINKTIDHEHMMRTTNIHELRLGDDWASHWKLAAHDMAGDLTESKKQSFLFDLIKFEQNFIQRAELFIDIAGPEFIKFAKAMVGSTSLIPLKDFEEKVLLSANELLAIHKKSLYEPLLRILVADGKFIKNLKGIAELYKEWAFGAKKLLLVYMSVMPMIEDLLENSALKKWDELIRSNPRMKALQVNGNLLLMSTFNSRYQQLPLQLLDVRKFFDEEDEEYTCLTKAVDAIRLLGGKVNEMKVHSDNIHALRLVEKQLTWKSNVFQPALNLTSSRRKFFYRGDLVRKGDLKINSHSAHVIVLDNYVLITEKQRAQKLNNYKVTESPIPLDYLIVENKEKESHVISVKPSLTQPSASEGNKVDEDSSSFPFKIRYAGRGKSESHTLIASSEKERKTWIAILVQARANLLKRVVPISPYTLKLVENAFFAYEASSKMMKIPILCSADPISVLAKQTSAIFSNSTRKILVQRQVQCSHLFNFMGQTFIFLGTDAGVYCSDTKSMWKKVINMNNVTKMTVLPELNIVLVLANKNLRYYPLQLLINIYYERKDKITSYQLSNEGVLFYEFGRHRGLPTLFVAKKKTAGSTAFKVFVLEVDNNGIFSIFTVIKRFNIPSECHGLSVFNSSVAVHTQKGFEVLDLQRLVPRSIPEIPSQDTKKLDGYSRKHAGPLTEGLKKTISHASPMGMFKLSNNKEFLMVYNECAIFVNKLGKLSRNTAIRFDFRPKNIAFVDNNLVLVCEEVVEVWSINIVPDGTNKLIQVIPSKDLHLLDASALCFKLVNPDDSDLQLVFTMSLRPDSPLLVQQKL